MCVCVCVLCGRKFTSAYMIRTRFLQTQEADFYPVINLSRRLFTSTFDRTCSPSHTQIPGYVCSAPYTCAHGTGYRIFYTKCVNSTIPSGGSYWIPMKGILYDTIVCKARTKIFNHAHFFQPCPFSSKKRVAMLVN